MVEIETGIPIPECDGKQYWLAMAGLEVNQSIVIPAHLRKQVHPRCRALGIKSRSKRIDDLSIRVWRVK